MNFLRDRGFWLRSKQTVHAFRFLSIRPDSLDTGLDKGVPDVALLR